MPTFVRFVSSDKSKIIRASLSPEVLDAIRKKGPTPVTAAAAEALLDYLLQHDDIWYEDALSLNPSAAGAFFAIKQAFHAEKLVAYAIPDASLEEEHIINVLKKRGYGPWY